VITSEPVQRPPVRALVVDDDPIIQRLLVAFLGARGYSVEQSSDGLEALERVRQGGFNLVVTDRNMPRMDGLALCRAVRAMPSETYLYCIMLTSMREEESLVAAMEAGVDDFLAKPLRLGELGARLHAAERMLSLEAGLASRNRALADVYPARCCHRSVRLVWVRGRQERNEKMQWLARWLAFNLHPCAASPPRTRPGGKRSPPPARPGCRPIRCVRAGTAAW